MAGKENLRKAEAQITRPSACVAERPSIRNDHAVISNSIRVLQHLDRRPLIVPLLCERIHAQITNYS